MSLTIEQKESIKKSFQSRGYEVRFDETSVIIVKGSEVKKIPQKDYAKLFDLMA